MQRIFKETDRVNCPVYGDGTVIYDSILVSSNTAPPYLTEIEVLFDNCPGISIKYTYDGRLNKGANITLRHKSDANPPLPVSAPFSDFKYAVGTDCWILRKESTGPILLRGWISSRILEECDQNVKSYRVKLEDDHYIIPAYEHEVFDVATRCNDALCKLSSLLRVKKA